MCPSSFSSTLVMDVEGTDGRERGEDQDFERKSALFSLASTEVLLVNLWCVCHRHLLSPAKFTDVLYCLPCLTGNTRSVYTKARTWVY
jgi:hypothetical protein